MSETTVIDAEFEETEITLEQRVQNLELQGKAILESQKNMLQNFRGLIEAITEQREMDEPEEEVFENIINLTNLSLVSSEE
tara:strand:- start:37 stop:279 length:243 start_codon:yes stop_codon:yes gene_type:complete